MKGLRYLHKQIVIEIDELCKKNRELCTEKHADKIVVVNGKAVVIEETDKAKIDDVKQVENTIRNLHRFLIASNVKNTNIEKVVGVIHASKGMDTMVAKALAAASRSGKVFVSANCENDLRYKLRALGIDIG